MNDFEWKSPLTQEEKHALSGYKDNTWIRINPCLRSGNVEDDLKEPVRLLDEAILKGRCTKATALFRATSNNCLNIEGDVIQPDRAFLSTSMRDDCIGQFFENDQPALLIINCLPETPMAAFEHNDCGGDEQERLLPRGMRFCIKAVEPVPNRMDMLKPEGPFNRTYMQLGRDVTIMVYILEPV